jgi:hypothetical protein
VSRTQQTAEQVICCCRSRKHRNGRLSGGPHRYLGHGIVADCGLQNAIPVANLDRIPIFKLYANATNAFG